jgi:energy-coupling factor transport system permease protein
VKRYFRKFKEKVSISYLREQVLENAYGNSDTPVAKLDPRVLLAWYCVFGLLPWFVGDMVLLLTMFVVVVGVAIVARIAPLIVFVFCVGVLSEAGYMAIMAIFFGGGGDIVLPVLIITLKVVLVSLASLAVFSGSDPERLASGFLWFHLPKQLVFAISFSYRIIPALLDEYQSILRSLRLRGNAPRENETGYRLRYITYTLQNILRSFYPLLMNMAKRSRAISESLALRGYLRALSNPAVRRLKLAGLRLGRRDYVFIAISLFALALGAVLAALFKTSA